MNSQIVVINPNSDSIMTQAIDDALGPMRFAGGPEIVCRTLAGAPIAIEDERDSARVVMPLCALIGAEEASAAAFVIACFSDPGLHAARETTTRPVFGIFEAGLTAALNLGDRVGMIHNLDADVAPARRHTRAMGIDARVAGDRAINVRVSDLRDEKLVAGRMLESGRALKAETGADVMVMGCSGMTMYRSRLEEELSVPVVDPTQAAVGIAMMAARIAYRHAAGAQ